VADGDFAVAAGEFTGVGVDMEEIGVDMAAAAMVAAIGNPLGRPMKSHAQSETSPE
jgi:hypothetical protein